MATGTDASPGTPLTVRRSDKLAASGMRRSRMIAFGQWTWARATPSSGDRAAHTSCPSSRRVLDTVSATLALSCTISTRATAVDGEDTDHCGQRPPGGQVAEKVRGPNQTLCRGAERCFMLYSPGFRRSFSRPTVVVCTSVGGCIEPNPRAARPRAARARSGDSPAAGEVQEKVRGRDQPRQRAGDAGRERWRPVVPRSRAPVAGARSQTAGYGRGRNRRIGEPSGSDVAMGRLLEVQGSLPFVRADGLHRQRQT